MALVGIVQMGGIKHVKYTSAVAIDFPKLTHVKTGIPAGVEHFEHIRAVFISNIHGADFLLGILT